MSKRNRDDFTEKTKIQIAKRAGWLCSDPSCRRPTVGSTSEGDGEINLGTAAHICAAAPGGPRYDPNQTPIQRRSADNGIWMCNLHGTAVDTKDSKFTVELLREWKAQAQKDSWRRVLYNDVPHGPMARPLTESELGARFQAAAAADLEVFRRSDKWPSTTIALTLEVDGLSEAVSTSALAAALAGIDDLILVAPPGMGKTTTLLQIAEAMLVNGNGLPIVVPLGDWATDNSELLESILKRSAFRGISEDDIRTLMAKPGVVLLLDGWNELDANARKRLTVQIARLQAELPELGLLISTRKQVLDVPVSGTRVNLLPLSEKQQRDIAKSLRGEAGIRMIDQAWRTAGVRELVTIPLYLTALLAIPEGAPFPSTKEEILRGFVAVHEQDSQCAEALVEVMHGLHSRLLEDLAVCATYTVNTTISEPVARKSVSDTNNALVKEGQITERPQPNTVLEALVSYHLLVRIGDPAGYSFQHQQFQEWYASHFVDRLMLASVDESTYRDKLKADVLNQPVWEEAILFACERLARGDQNQQEACAAAILTALEVDPMLAAEMIFRASDGIWERIAPDIQSFVRRWHTTGSADRALRFMINSGRPEFFDQVWPLITHENDQVHLSALRTGRRFRPSLLGNEAAQRIAALPMAVRKNVLHEIVFNSEMDGLDLAAAIAGDDPDPEVKTTVVDALAFRHADRHIADVLKDADEKTLDLVARNGLVDDVDDKLIKEKIDAAHERLRRQKAPAYERLRIIVSMRGNEELNDDLATIISEIEIDKEKEDAIVHLIHDACKHYSQAVADGLLQRVRAGRTLFYGVDDLLSSAGLALDDQELLEIALYDTNRNDSRARAATAVLGPDAVGRIIDAVLEAKKHLRDANGKFNQDAGDRYHELLSRIRSTPGPSLIAAVSSRSALAGNEEMADLADMICRHPNGKNYRGRTFDADALAQVCVLAEEWGNRMLDSANSTRWQLASIARLISRAQSESLLQLLKRLLDEELRRYRMYIEKAKAMDWRQGMETNEASTIYTLEYQRAFQAINTPETAVLMRGYLRDEDFGHNAALVLAAQWTSANEPNDGENVRGGIDFSRVEEKRSARADDPSATSAEAEAIFSSIQPLIIDEATEDQKKHAVALGIVAARLPHGQRDATIRKLISLASRRSRAALLQNLVLSGEIIDIEVVKDGLEEVFEAAKTQSWILSEGGYELREWLRLLPFANPLTEALTIVRSLPEEQRRADRLEDMIACFGFAPGNDAENVLFQLADADPKLFANHTWRDAVICRGTLSAAQRFVDLAAKNMFEGRRIDSWHMARQIGVLIDDHPELRTHVYQLFKDGITAPGLALLACAVVEAPDVDGLLLLTKIGMDHNRSFIPKSAIKTVVTEHKPSESWKGAYEVIPVPTIELRRKLLALTTDGGSKDLAARYLTQIDEIRDEYGMPDSEARHPDLSSGKPWPIMISNQEMRPMHGDCSLKSI